MTTSKQYATYHNKKSVSAANLVVQVANACPQYALQNFPGVTTKTAAPQHYSDTFLSWAVLKYHKAVAFTSLLRRANRFKVKIGQPKRLTLRADHLRRWNLVQMIDTVHNASASYTRQATHYRRLHVEHLGDGEDKQANKRQRRQILDGGGAGGVAIKKSSSEHHVLKNNHTCVTLSWRR